MKFSATSRTSPPNGNTILYSLNESFVDDVLWKFSALESEDEEIKGDIEKLRNGEPIEFEPEEAKSAIRGAFLGAENVELREFTESVEEEDLFEAKKVAFTLRTHVGDWADLKEFEEKKWKDPREEFTMETGVIREENSVSNVFGLLIFDEITSLEKCSQILASFFPRKIITWMSYCVSEPGWRRGCME